MNHYKSIYYKGLEYNIEQFVQTHPGGKSIIQNYLRSNQDITLAFKSIHSKEAEETLLKLKVEGKVERSKNQKIYLKIEQRVSKLYELSYFLEISIIILISFFVLITFIISQPSISVISLASSQILAAWSCHSQLHSRISFPKKCGKVIGNLVLGLSWRWWVKKHTNHHIFTNNEQFDEDINHSYRTIVFPFLLFKWRIESIFHALINFSFTEVLLIALHYYILFKIKSTYILLGLFIASFYLSVIFFGNHEREKRYRREHLDDFLNHQLETTVDYQSDSEWGLLMLGGFQYHLEHHLFPQIPFYNLAEANKIINQELLIYKKKVKVSTLI